MARGRDIPLVERLSRCSFYLMAAAALAAAAALVVARKADLPSLALFAAVAGAVGITRALLGERPILAADRPQGGAELPQVGAGRPLVLKFYTDG